MELNKYTVLNPEGTLVLKEVAILNRASLAAEKSKTKRQIKLLAKKVMERPSIREIVSKVPKSIVKKKKLYYYCIFFFIFYDAFTYFLKFNQF